MMRIITGKARGVKLRTLDGEVTRPTSERAKEAIFSMLQFDIEGRRILDAFAGSGQMGLEALSRGALSAVFVDKNNEAFEIIKTNTELTKLKENATVICADLEKYLEKIQSKTKFDIVFLDPPYRSPLLKSSLECLIRYDLLSNNATIVCESGVPIEEAITPELIERFNIIKTVKYGIAFVSVMKLKR